MSYLEVLDRHLGARYSQHTRRAFLGQGRRFLMACGVKPAYSRADVLAYVDDLIRAGYKAQSIGTILSGIRVLFDVNGLAWPLAARDLRLGLPQETPARPALLVQEAADLIRSTRYTPGLPRTVCALTTVWGLRGDEVVRVLGKGCLGETLEIQTAKGGQRRTHAIPPWLKPALAFRPTKTTPRYLHTVFEDLMTRHVRAPAPHEGWHALRRTVVTALLDAGIEERKLVKWMGWRYKESIVTIYDRTSPETLDAAIYAVHPFLKVWRGD